MLITSTVEICIQQLGRVEEMFLPRDAAMLARSCCYVASEGRTVAVPWPLITACRYRLAGTVDVAGRN